MDFNGKECPESRLKERKSKNYTRRDK